MMPLAPNNQMPYKYSNRMLVADLTSINTDSQQTIPQKPDYLTSYLDARHNVDRTGTFPTNNSSP